MVQTLEVKASDKHLLVVNEEHCWLDVDGTVLLGKWVLIKMRLAGC